MAEKWPGRSFFFQKINFTLFFENFQGQGFFWNILGFV